METMCDLFSFEFSRYSLRDYIRSLSERVIVDFGGVVDLIDEKHRESFYLDKACEGGHRDLVDLICVNIEKGVNDCNKVFYGSCCGSGSDSGIGGIYYWNMGLYGACHGGHRDLAELMIERGSKYWNLGLMGACQGGHRDLVDLMIEKGARDWNLGLQHARMNGHPDLVNLMIEMGAENWDDGRIYFLCD